MTDSIMRNVDTICSPEAAVSFLESIIPASADADLVINTLSRKLSPTEGDKVVWRVWHSNTVEVGSLQDFAITNFIVSTHADDDMGSAPQMNNYYSYKY